MLKADDLATSDARKLAKALPRSGSNRLAMISNGETAHVLSATTNWVVGSP